MLWYHIVYCFTDNQSLKEQGRRTHIHIPHTLLVPHSLIHCCHGNPIKGGQSGNNSGEIILSPFYLSLSLSRSFTHMHPPSLSFTASHFYFVSLHYFFLPHPLSFSSSPCITLGTPLCPSLSITMLPFHLFTSRLLHPR